MTTVDNESALVTDSGATGAFSALPVTLTESLRRAVARRIRRNRTDLVRGWLDRHSALPRYAAHVQLVVDNWDVYRRRYAEPLNYVLAQRVRRHRGTGIRSERG